VPELTAAAATNYYGKDDIPCPVVFLKVRCLQPDALLAGKHGQSMCIYCSCTFICSMYGTLYTKIHTVNCNPL